MSQYKIGQSSDILQDWWQLAGSDPLMAALWSGSVGSNAGLLLGYLLGKILGSSNPGKLMLPGILIGGTVGGLLPLVRKVL